jgi:RND family efflux transporter MFP subunit
MSKAMTFLRSSARVFKCKIQVDNPQHLLKPGIFAKVEISHQQKVEAVTVPIEALSGNEGNFSVFVNNNGVASQRSVTIGETIGGLVEINSGLQQGESVIVTNVNMLQDGDAITVVCTG